MNTITVAGAHSLYIGAAAHLVDTDREMAWAEKYVKNNPAYKWILGRYVQADLPNENGHIFPLEELQANLHSLDNAPLNMLHRAHHVVGAYAGSDLLYPTEASDAAPPHAEALAAFWRYYFEDEFAAVEVAHKEGALFYSMECVPRAFACVDEACGGKEYEYAGRTSASYCAHLNQPRSQKKLMTPHFLGGALIIPPTKPGWKNADITELSSLIESNLVEAELTYAQLERDFGHLETSDWEHMMGQVLEHMAISAEHELARSFSDDDRKKMAGNEAMDDGSFPIKNVSDLKNAIQAVGRAKDIAKAKAHIKKRAAALGAENLIPEGW